MNYKLCYTFAPYILIQQRKLNIHYHYLFKIKYINKDVHILYLLTYKLRTYKLKICVALQA